MSVNFNYGKFIGALITAQLPYAFMVFCGFFFGKVGLIQKEGIYAFSKMNIEIFLPIYLFIQVCRSNFTYNYEENGVIIISFIFYFIFSFIICFLYSFFTKMDLRYRFTFIFLTGIIDIKRIHYLYINSFCYFLKNKLSKEQEFCKNILVYSYIHVFYQGLIIWFCAYNLIKLDKSYENQAIEVWDEIHKKKKSEEEQNLKEENKEEENKEEEKKEENKEENKNENENENEDYLNDNKLSEREKNEVKEIYNNYAINNNEEINKENNSNEDVEEMIMFSGRQSFYSKISKYQKKKFFESSNIKMELLKLIFRSPFIALIIAFIIGFIRVIREWIYDTTTPVYLFFDTFNTIGNCNILLGFLMIGSNLYYKNTINKKNSNAKIRLSDYIFHSIVKVIILPFLGILFCFIIKKKFIDDNKVLLFTCFIQWVIPTSIDIMSIVQVEDINCKFVAYSISIQIICQIVLNNFIHFPTFLKMIDIL